MTLRSAQKVFDQFITGENSDDRNKFEELLTSHSEIASDLRKLYERHRAAERAIEHALPDPLGLAGEETFFGGRSRSHYRPTPRIQPGQQLGDFKLIRPLGSGGMGEETLENEVPDACTRLESRPAGGFVHRIAGIPTVTTRSIMSTGLGITASRADSPQDELTRVVGVSGHGRGGGRSKGSSEQGRDGRRKRPIYEWAPS